ncbi:MAG: hypothetical protein M1835_004196 [Candelina submexicana]|nr:MAG: hypothetical protein M1835_004196 [Candelina submexicana]
MLSATSTTTTLQSKPIHIPKLTYRNAAPPPHNREDSSDSIPTLSSAFTDDSVPLSRPPYISKLSFRNGLSYTPRKSTSTFSTSASSLTVSTPPSSPGLSEYQYTETFSNGQSPTEASLGSPAKSTKGGKRKAGSIFNFFALKEPSTQAFVDFQEQARRQAAAKNGRPIAVGLPGVSSAKLPPTVPKVNSKWDGVPETVKYKHKRKSSSLGRTGITGLAGGPSRRSSSTRNSNSSRDRPGSMLSQGSNGSGKYSWNEVFPEIGSAGASSSDLSLSRGHAPSANSTSLKSPSTTSLPTMTSFFLPEIPQQYLNDVPPVQRDQQPLAQRPATSASSPSEAPTGTHRHQSHVSLSSNGRSKYSSNPKLSEPIPPFPVEVVVKSSGAGVLGPPMTTKRKPKPRALPAREAEPIKNPKSKSYPPISKCESIQTSTPIRPPITSYSVKPGTNPGSNTPSGADSPVKHFESFRPRYERGSSTRSQDSTPWEFESPKIEVQNRDQCKPQPVHASSRSFFRRGMKSMFNK